MNINTCLWGRSRHYRSQGLNLIGRQTQYAGNDKGTLIIKVQREKKALVRDKIHSRWLITYRSDNSQVLPPAQDLKPTWYPLGAMNK